ncbi:MAG: response regulator transcription factor [Bacteroidetes bacterium]|nr:response regulator transcription factor [Bacteroidota bacterium]
MNLHRCLIVDDESKARLLLRTLITEYCPELFISAECDDLDSAIAAIRKHKPDIVFLDIEMPGKSGLDILEQLNPEEVDFEIVFTTAYNEYAIQAFRLAALDYILKPIQYQRLRETVERFLSKTNPRELRQLEVLRRNLAPESDRDRRIAIPVGQSYKFYKVDDLVMIKGEGAYSEITITTGEKLMVSKNLKYFGELLGPIPFFFRCHKSYMINTHHVKEFTKSEGGRVVLQGEVEAGISGEKVDEFLKIMNLKA